jgi:hypothetical protein
MKNMKGVMLVHMGIEGTTMGLILGTIILICIIGYFQEKTNK